MGTNPQAALQIQTAFCYEINHGLVVLQFYLVKALTFLQNHAKLIAQLIVIIIFGFLASIEKESQSWVGSRRAGLLQQGFCTAAGQTYAVEDDVNILAPNDDEIGKSLGPPVFEPLVVQIGNSRRGSTTTPTICATQVMLKACATLFATTDSFFGLTSESLTKSLSVKRRPIMLYSEWVVVFTAISFVLSLFFESGKPGAGGERPGAVEQKILAVRINAVIVTIVIGLLLSSGQAFTLIQDIKCSADYDTPDDNFCQVLASCGGGVAVVTDPPQTIIHNYRELCVFLCAFLIAACFVRRSDYNSSSASRPGRVLSGDDSVHNHNLDRIVEALNNRLNEHRGTGNTRQFLRDGNHLVVVEGVGAPPSRAGRGQQRVDQSFVSSVQEIAKRNAMIAKWSVHPSSALVFGGRSSSPLDGRCCSICLETLCALDVEGGGEDKLIAELPCGHLFHQACIISWATRQIIATCPECRHSLEP